VFGIACDSATITQLCQNGGLLVLSSIGETEKEGGWGTTAMMVLVKNSLVKKEM
jgi:hypothetical protein